MISFIVISPSKCGGYGSNNKLVQSQVNPINSIKSFKRIQTLRLTINEFGSWVRIRSFREKRSTNLNVNGVRSFSGLHFVHLFVLDEEVVPVVPEDVKQVIGYCSSDGQFRIVLYSLMGQIEL